MRKVEKQGNVYVLVQEEEERSAAEARSAHLNDSLTLASAEVNLDSLVRIVQHLIQRVYVLEQQK